MADIQKKLLAAMQEMENPIKDKSAYKYQYADLSQVLGIIKPVLYKHGLGLLQYSDYENEIPFLITAVFDDDESKELSRRRVYDYSDAQMMGSCDTYTRRYELLKVFCLAPEDDDGAATKQKKLSPELEKAQQRLWKAEQRYCELNGIQDAKQYHKQEIMTRDDYKNNAKSLNAIAEELESV